MGRAARIVVLPANLRSVALQAMTAVVSAVTPLARRTRFLRADAALFQRLHLPPHIEQRMYFGAAA
ncbi:hypothetical protein EBN15_06055 [Xanthomonas cucurbitae]|nr:hypothetical protein EBN15_06055 [Xanthomonas cucurbitae]